MNVLILVDVMKEEAGKLIGWAYFERGRILRSLAPDDISIDLMQMDQLPYVSAGKYDLIFNLDYMNAKHVRRVTSEIGFEGVIVTSFNKDSRSRDREWSEALRWSDFLIINNLDRFESEGRPQGTCAISNGVDADFWTPGKVRPSQDRVLWVGGTGPKKGKNYYEVLVPLQAKLHADGFECDFRPVTQINANQVLDRNGQREWYRSGRYVVCASSTEGGGPNFLMEGMACGCVPVSTAVGSVPEYIEQGVNGFLIEEPDVELLYEALLHARADYGRLSEQAAIHMQKDWNYSGPDGEAQWFYALFRALKSRGPEGISPFYSRETHYSEI